MELDEKSEERRDVGLLNLTKSGAATKFFWGGGGVEKTKSPPHDTKNFITQEKI